ncbi:MAG: hypothetical protein U0175_11505 [Caldilineaceae bacterium]
MEHSGLRKSYPASALFTVRVWRETVSEEPNTLCIQVKHVLSGETRYFRECSQVFEYFAGKVPTTELSDGSNEL